MNPFVFLVGCPRSGTTLLQRLVDAHPQLAIIHETFWIPGFFERRVGLTPAGLVTPALVPRLLEHRRFGQLGVGLDDLEGLIAEKESLAYSDFVSALFDQYGREHGKELVGTRARATSAAFPRRTSSGRARNSST